MSVLGLLTDMVLPVLTQPHYFYSYNLCLSPSFSLLCALLLHSSLLLTLSFSLSRILSCIMSRFLAHVLTGMWCSPSRVVLLLCSHCLLWFHSLHFYILWFWYFVWVDFRSLVFPSLSTRGMFSYLCMLIMFSGCLYHRFKVSKIFGPKNFK